MDKIMQYPNKTIFGTTRTPPYITLSETIGVTVWDLVRSIINVSNFHGICTFSKKKNVNFTRSCAFSQKA